MDIASISAAISAFTGTTKLIGAAIDTRDAAKLSELKIAMNDQLLQLSTAALAINEKLAVAHKEKSDLEDEIRQLRKQIADQSHYQLHTFPTGVHAFKDIRMESRDVGIYFCAACMSEGRETILQPSSTRRYLHCAFKHDSIEIIEDTETIQTMGRNYDPYSPGGLMGS